MQEESPIYVAEEESTFYGNAVFLENIMDNQPPFPHTPQTEDELDKELMGPHHYLSPEQSLQTLTSWSLA